MYAAPTARLCYLEVRRGSNIEQVYAYIWCCITEREVLPAHDQIAEALGIRREIMGGCIYALRKQGRLSETTLLTRAYPAWWCENVHREQRWNMDRAQMPTSIFGSRKVT